MDAGVGVKALRGDRTGQDRPDSERAADRSPSAHRRGRRRHEVQEPSSHRGVEARSGAAEPHPRRRHRVRSREAARRVEAPGRQSAALQAAARRTAAMGESPVRREVSVCSDRPSRPREPSWPMRASARRPLRRGSPSSIRRSNGCASSSWRPTARPPRRARPRTRARWRSAVSSSRLPFDRQQIEQLSTAAAGIETEVRALDARQEPARLELDARRDAALRAGAERDAAAATLAAEEAAYVAAQRQIEGLEADVEAARSDVFAAVNAATALRHAMEHAVAARAQDGGADRRARGRRSRSRRRSRTRRRRARRRRPGARPRAFGDGRAARRSRRPRVGALRRAGGSRRPRVSELRTREHDLAALLARLTSLEEFDAARAQYGDGARTILAESPDDVGQMGSVADYLEVDRRYERAVEACLGEWLQHVVVASHAHAEAGLRLARDRNAGRVGFVVADSAAQEASPAAIEVPPGLTPAQRCRARVGPRR